MATRPPRRRRARPVADAPIDELLSRTDELAKGWLLELLEQSPLELAAAIAGSALIVEGPRICAAVLQALADDHDFRRLEAGGVLEPLVAGCAAFAGSDDTAGALRAVDALHGIVWTALRRELRDADPDQVYELAERLTAVIELVRAAALERQVSGGTPSGAPRLTSVPAAEAPPSAPPPPDGPPAATPPSAPAAQEPEASAAQPARPAPVPPAPVPPAQVSPEPEPVTAEPEPVTAAPAPPSAPRREDTLWVAALEDGERLAAGEPEAEVTAAFGRFAQAVRSVLRRQDLLASESGTRVWVIARDTGRAGATALAERINGAVRAADALRGAPLTVNVGVAVLGEDAHTCAGLLEAAEEACFAAAAAGAAIAGGPPEATRPA
jgi:outer membrane biosynthesis protein TonB